MSYTIESSDYFDREAKRLKKRYRSFVSDFDDFVIALREK